MQPREFHRAIFSSHHDATCLSEGGAQRSKWGCFPMLRPASAVVAVSIACASVLVVGSSARADTETPPLAAPPATTVANQNSDPSPETVAGRPSTDDICATLEIAATVHDLPLPFFTRLIWQESRFRPDAVSRAGARGIAQFMPRTAQWRGLADPHDPIESLHKSADYLRDLRTQFGNLGLAAAAYNGGAGRVAAWLKGRGRLPKETRDYVQIVTGVPADQWRVGEQPSVAQASHIPSRMPCPTLAWLGSTETPIQYGPVRAPTANQSGWSVVLAGSFSRDKAQGAAERLQSKFGSLLQGRQPVIVSRAVAGRGKAPVAQVRIAESSRASAETLCAKLRSGGASCMVLRSS